MKAKYVTVAEYLADIPRDPDTIWETLEALTEFFENYPQSGGAYCGWLNGETVYVRKPDNEQTTTQSDTIGVYL